MRMSKFGIGVGNEFPTEEIHRDENGVVHHHHYYRRHRHPFRLLRIILAVLLIGLVFRAFHHLRVFEWDVPVPPWMPAGYAPFAGTLFLILVVSGLLYLLSRHDHRERS
jgi:hypothetical protein